VKIVVDASNPGKIFDLVKENQVELILSPSIIKEIKRILLYPKIQKYHRKSVHEIDAYFEDILMFAWVVEGKEPVDVIKDDPTDNVLMKAKQIISCPEIITCWTQKPTRALRLLNQRHF